jgi:IclR family transcriptional regulator, pca regulon regulatory protein
MSMGTAHRYLLTLRELGYVAQSGEDRKYRLTWKVLSLGFSVFNGLELRKRVLPYMIQMTKEMSLTTHCAILDDTEIVYIEKVRSKDVVDLDLTVGSRLPAYCTAMGKTILAFMGESQSREIISRSSLIPHTPFTITSKRALLKELETIRQRGFAVSNQELMVGLRTLAAPIFSHGKIEAAVGVSYPSHRVEGSQREKKYIDRLLELASMVSIG